MKKYMQTSQRLIVLVCALGLGMVPVLFAPPLGEGHGIGGEGFDDPGLMTNDNARDLEDGHGREEPITRAPKRGRDHTHNAHDARHDVKRDIKKEERREQNKKNRKKRKIAREIEREQENNKTRK